MGDMPKTTGEAFARIGAFKDGGVTIDDLKLLALVEAIGKALYDDLATRAPNAEVKALLEQHGREELRHGERLSEVIEHLTGEPFPIPPLDQIPFYTPLDPMPVTRESLNGLAQGEFSGKELYNGVASSFTDPKALAVFTLNGDEEAEHGRNILAIIDQLPE
jgi:rubrerythrin